MEGAVLQQHVEKRISVPMTQLSSKSTAPRSIWFKAEYLGSLDWEGSDADAAKAANRAIPTLMPMDLSHLWR